jgi:hypothetical protein
MDNHTIHQVDNKVGHICPSKQRPSHGTNEIEIDNKN